MGTVGVRDQDEIERAQSRFLQAIREVYPQPLYDLRDTVFPIYSEWLANRTADSGALARHDLISGARKGKTATCYCISMLSTLMVLSSCLVPVTLADTAPVAGVAGSVDRSARLFRASVALEFPALSNL